MKVNALFIIFCLLLIGLGGWAVYRLDKVNVEEFHQHLTAKIPASFTFEHSPIPPDTVYQVREIANVLTDTVYVHSDTLGRDDFVMSQKTFQDVLRGESLDTLAVVTSLITAWGVAPVDYFSHSMKVSLLKENIADDIVADLPILKERGKVWKGTLYGVVGTFAILGMLSLIQD